jgi:hypothetical protein
MRHHFPRAGIEPKDTDIIGTLDEFREWTKGFEKGEIILCKPLSADKIHVRTKDGWNFEWEIAKAGNCAQELLDYFDLGQAFAPTSVLLALKLSHRYKRNSPHFLKTMRDIQFLRKQGVTLGTELEEWLPKREAETYTYAHPKLDVSKAAFFDGDGVPYVYEHDSIHEAVALIQVSEKDFTGTGTQWAPRPAYTYYAGGPVWSSKEKFFRCSEQIRLYGVYEESCVLALERSQIPFPDASPRKSFEYALMKVCTSITSGWFRQYAYENYDKVMALYEELGEDDYIQRFKRNSHLLKPYKEAYGIL